MFVSRRDEDAPRNRERGFRFAGKELRLAVET
jgi:hypothetical protein